MAHSIGCQTARLQKALSDKVNDYNRIFKDKEADTKAVLFRCDLQDNTLLYASDDLIGLTIHDELMKDGDRETAKLLDPNNNTRTVGTLTAPNAVTKVTHTRTRRSTSTHEDHSSRCRPCRSRRNRGSRTRNRYGYTTS